MTRDAALAENLVKLPVALIVAAGTQAVCAALHASKTIPIVVAIMPDPVALGFAESLARPGRNVTGVASLFEELTPQQLQIFREVMPGAKRIALLSDLSMGDSIQSATESAARKIGPIARVVYATDARSLDAAINTARDERSDTVLVLPSPAFNRNRARIAELATKARLPTFSESSEYVKDGGLLSHGPNFPQMYFAAASYVDRILKGAKAGDLPIERPTKFELAVNLQTARELGIMIPQALLLRADEVIQ
jgi:putative ABC transport system substrate-binding protein